MIDDLESGMTVKEAMIVPAATGLAWRIEERARYSLPSSEEVVVTLAEADEYFHLGFRGRLVCEFYNDMLSRAFFFPERFDEYLAELSRSEGIDLRGSPRTTQIESTVIWSSTYPGDEPFVAWRDDRILGHFADSK